MSNQWETRRRVAVFLVDGTKHFEASFLRAGFRFRYERRRSWNSLERDFMNKKRRTSFYCPCHAGPETAENWL